MCRIIESLTNFSLLENYVIKDNDLIRDTNSLYIDIVEYFMVSISD